MKAFGFCFSHLTNNSIIIDKNSVLRAEAGIRHILNEYSGQGHCAILPQKLIQQYSAMLEIASEIIEQGITNELANGNVIKDVINNEAYLYNVLFAPGLTNDLHPSQITSIITNTQNRGDSLFVMDLTSYDGLLVDALTQAQTRDTSYAATYWPWVRIVDPATGKQVWAPASTVIPGVYAFNDKVSAPWFAPAGINRGGLSTVLRAQYRLSQAQKDTLYSSNVNPLATLPKQGVVVFGQKTLQKAASALDRVNVRRLLIELKSYIRQIADTVVFEQNTISTRNSFLVRVNPYLETIQQKQGLYAFKVIMDDTNNGPDVIDRNQLVGQIYIQPTRTAEFISLDFILLPTGAEFPG
jgi:phage tail sheath protein FI